MRRAWLAPYIVDGMVPFDIYALLGEDKDAPEHVLARDLVAADEDLVAQLVRARTQAEMSQSDVARMMGTSQSAVSRFEAGHTDPRLSSVRRYAMAVGAAIRHDVRPAQPQVRRTSSPLGDDVYSWADTETLMGKRVAR